MTRSVVVIACTLLVGCFQSHPAGQQELSGTECYGCHATDYAATAQPVHRDKPQVYSTTCTSCHVMTSWMPALEGAHSPVFIIASGPHAPIACLDCHMLDASRPSAKGANTNCIQCHPNDAHQIDTHREASKESGLPYAYLANVPNFCVTCHPSGIATHEDEQHAIPGSR